MVKANNSSKEFYEKFYEISQEAIIVKVVFEHPNLAQVNPQAHAENNILRVTETLLLSQLSPEEQAFYRSIQ